MEERRKSPQHPKPGDPAFPAAIEEREHAIVLVHGAWVGEYSWGPILNLLRSSGRPVHAVSLTGHGSRSHQNGPHITLQDHVDDVVSLIRTHDLQSVTLVGHSYGGRVITAVWTEISERINKMIYLDAHAPFPDQAPNLAATSTGQDKSPGMIPFDRHLPDPEEFGGTEAVAWFLDRAMPQSALTVQPTPPVTLPDELDKTFVFATIPDNSRFELYAQAARQDPSWRVFDLPGSHWLMVSHPNTVTAIILDPSGHSATELTGLDN